MKNSSHPPAQEEGGGEKAPIWIISFADMVSLLMAFFIMLQTMATTRSGTLCNRGTGVFEETIKGFKTSISGLGVFSGRGYKALELNSNKAYYAPGGDSNDTSGRLIDAKQEKTRRLFATISKFAETRKPQIRGEKPNFVITPIKFEMGQATLNEPAKQFLIKFADDLKQSSKTGGMIIYIVGIAQQEPNIKQQWVLSAKRAQVVADFLRNLLPSATEWPVYSWGAGTGGDWVDGKNPVSEQSQILIAVLKTG